MSLNRLPYQHRKNRLGMGFYEILMTTVIYCVIKHSCLNSNMFYILLAGVKVCNKIEDIKIKLNLTN